MAKLILQTDDQFESTLTKLVNDNPDANSKADIVQRAVATYKYFQDAIKNNQQIQLVDGRNPASIVAANIKLP